LDFCFQNENCEVRLARSDDEIIMAQKLRYHVFYELMSATPSEECRVEKRDFDHFDDLCDHLLVIDTSDPDNHHVVGNYRLLCADSAKEPDYFYSHQEYDITPLIMRSRQDNMQIMELGRSCVHPDFRSNAIIQMLWRGIVTYAMARNVGLMFGCASFSGTDLETMRDHLAYLHEYRLAPPEWRARAREHICVEMENKALIEGKTEREMLAVMPPLIKGYLRLGAWIGDGAVLDEDFSTTDVLITLPVAQIGKRYLDFFGRSS